VRMLSTLSRLPPVRPCSQATWAAISSVQVLRSLPKARGLCSKSVFRTRLREFVYLRCGKHPETLSVRCF
jgi:hypothetical protein